MKQSSIRFLTGLTCVAAGFMVAPNINLASATSASTESASGYSELGEKSHLSASDGMLCTGGPESRLHAFLEPSDLKGSNSERARFNLVVESRHSGKIDVVHATEFVDDKGTAITPPTIFPSSSMQRNEAKDFPLITPKRVNDGFYTLRVSVAGVGAGVEASHVLEQYFEVENGEIYNVDSETYFGQSQANVGVRL